MSPASPQVMVALAALVWTSAAQAAPPASEQPFLAGQDAVMARMDAGMDIKPTGDVDADFAGMMIPHHQGAIDMAVLELRYGRNEQLRRIAQEIIVEQQQEIAAMQLALGRPPPRAEPAPTGPSPEPMSMPMKAGR